MLYSFVHCHRNSQGRADNSVLNHFAAPSFWECYKTLPPAVQKLADKNFGLLKSSSVHPSLHFKKVGRHWSARVGADFRALALRTEDGFLWF